jgi:type IV secretion system protein VirB5
MRRCGHPAAIATAILLVDPGASAQMAVIDVSALAQQIQLVIDDAQKIAALEAQLQEAKRTVASLTGVRGLAAALNSPALQNYLPPQAYRLADQVVTRGYAGLSDLARRSRDAQMVYNCAELAGTAQTRCQALLAQPYQQRALLQQAVDKAAGRLAQITALMQQAAATTDPKAIAEMQARIGAEDAMLAHERSQIELNLGISQADQAITASQHQEADLANVMRSRNLLQWLPQAPGGTGP